MKQVFRDLAIEAEIDDDGEDLLLGEEEYRSRRNENGELLIYPLELEEICAWTAAGWLRSALYPIAGYVRKLTPETKMSFFATMTLPPIILIDTFEDIFQLPIDQDTIREDSSIRDVVSEALFAGNRPKEPVVAQYPSRKAKYQDEKACYFDDPALREGST